jgi:hypothetical protein
MAEKDDKQTAADVEAHRLPDDEAKGEKGAQDEDDVEAHGPFPGPFPAPKGAPKG